MPEIDVGELHRKVEQLVENLKKSQQRETVYRERAARLTQIVGCSLEMIGSLCDKLVESGALSEEAQSDIYDAGVAATTVASFERLDEFDLSWFFEKR